MCTDTLTAIGSEVSQVTLTANGSSDTGPVLHSPVSSATALVPPPRILEGQRIE